MFMGLFIVLFAASGVGNGSTFRTIGVIFDRQQAGPYWAGLLRSPPMARSSPRW
jgi:nitrate/nitrite transporter NarK